MHTCSLLTVLYLANVPAYSCRWGECFGVDIPEMGGVDEGGIIPCGEGLFSVPTRLSNSSALNSAFCFSSCIILVTNNINQSIF